MKCAIYARVSTGEQEEENQLVQLREYAKNKEWEVYKEYAEKVSGKEDSRPEFNAMFADAHKLLFGVILFWDLSRFSRSGTLFTLQKFKELDNLGIAWHSYSDQYLSSAGPFKDVVISIMATLAKIEREKISQRTKAGLELARKKPTWKVRGKDKHPRKPRCDRGKKRVIVARQLPSEKPAINL